MPLRHTSSELTAAIFLRWFSLCLGSSIPPPLPPLTTLSQYLYPACAGAKTCLPCLYYIWIMFCIKVALGVFLHMIARLHITWTASACMAWIAKRWHARWGSACYGHTHDRRKSDLHVMQGVEHCVWESKVKASQTQPQQQQQTAMDVQLHLQHSRNSYYSSALMAITAGAAYSMTLDSSVAVPTASTVGTVQPVAQQQR